MESKPMPVVMLSTMTQKGAQTSFKALELGAVDCFPKPQQATPAEFDKIVDKHGKLVIAAASGKVRAKSIKAGMARSEEQTAELQSHMVHTYDVLCLQKKNQHTSR